MDIFYTPASVARKMLECVTVEAVTVIADFTAGGGELLRTATEKWPSARYVASELDAEVSASLRKSFPNWRVETLDFLNSGGAKPWPLEDIKGSVSLVLLNPPFSSRGAVRYSSIFNDKELRSSRGLAFVIEALKYLAPDGQLISILPAGSLTSEKDSKCWHTLSLYYKIDRFGRNGASTFTSCTPETVIVRFTRRKKIVNLRRKAKINVPFRLDCADPVTVQLFRGKLAVGDAKNGTRNTVPFVHTTSLSEKKLDLWSWEVNDIHQTISGPAVLIPRVGRPKASRSNVYLGRNRVVLSDCVIAIRCESSKDARSIHALIQDNWQIFEALYQGTCARFITLSGLGSFLTSAGVVIKQD